MCTPPSHEDFVSVAKCHEKRRGRRRRRRARLYPARQTSGSAALTACPEVRVVRAHAGWYIGEGATSEHLILTLMAQAPSSTRVCGPWGPLIARRPCPQGDPAVCTGFGSCTVSIFPCPVSALGLGRPIFFFGSRALLTLTLLKYLIKYFNNQIDALLLSHWSSGSLILNSDKYCPVAASPGHLPRCALDQNRTTLTTIIKINTRRNGEAQICGKGPLVR